MSENKGKNTSKRTLWLIAVSGIFAALVFIDTQIRFPTAIGYINFGDAVILVASYFIGPVAFFPAAIGSALSDLIAGYPMYIAPTFVIKGIMGVVAGLIMLKAKGKNFASFIIRVIAAAAAELIMVGGYFSFETVYYDVAAAAGSVPFNFIQAGAAAVVAIPLTYAIRIKKQK